MNNTNTSELKEMTTEVIDFLQEIGFIVLCIDTDNNRINQSLFKALANKEHPHFFPNPLYNDMKIFLFFDFVHELKNIRNNWINVKNFDKSFIYPHFETGENRKASFQHIREKYYTENNLEIKEAFKLNYKSCFSNNIDRQKVSYAMNVFHDSTIASLKKNSDTVETAEFLTIIRNWWSIVNTKSKNIGIVSRNDFAGPFYSSDDNRLEFLQKFVQWLDHWNNIENNNGRLTKDTYNAIRLSTETLIQIIPYCFEKIKIKFILPGKFQTDDLEKRFGRYRRLAGTNYHVSVTEVKESEKKIRIQRIYQHCHDFNTDVRLIEKEFEQEEVNSTDNLKPFMEIFSSDYLQKCEVDESARLHYSGYSAFSISKKLKCFLCKSNIIESKGEQVDDDYFDSMQRGGLIVPTDEVKFVLTHMLAIFQYIKSQPNLKNLFLASKSHKNTLMELTMSSLDFNDVIDFTWICSCGLESSKLFKMICSPMANKILDNFTRNVNDSNLVNKIDKRKLSKYEKSNQHNKKIRIE